MKTPHGASLLQQVICFLALNVRKYEVIKTKSHIYTVNMYYSSSPHMLDFFNAAKEAGNSNYGIMEYQVIRI